jgi:hypothetical protein
MSRYEPLWKHLQSDGRNTSRLTFEEIKALLGFDIDTPSLIVLGFDIDPSFLTRENKKEAAQYGYEVGKISMREKHVTFNKIGGNQNG